jgi:carbon storage regulator
MLFAHVVVRTAATRVRRNVIDAKSRRQVMLVLTRKVGESLVIAGNTVVRVLEVRGNKIRIGIEAPENVSIVRTELIDTRQERDPIASVN